MIRVLITGSGSYIGESLQRYLAKWPQEYTVDTVDMTDDSWRERDLSIYDAVFHVAGIVHMRESAVEALLYKRVNCDLAVETAQKAKREGVRQFVFMSTMGVYGMDSGVITPETAPAPRSLYGRSKLAAEAGLSTLADADFRLAVLRPPLVYGPGCKGNFQPLKRIAEKSPIFPRVKNQRSMLYIDHLSAFVKLLIDRELGGLFFPQNSEYVETAQMVGLMAKTLHKRLYMSRLAGALVRMLRPAWPRLQKAFGDLIYRDTEVFDFSYCICGFEESVRRSVRGEVERAG